MPNLTLTMKVDDASDIETVKEELTEKLGALQLRDGKDYRFAVDDTAETHVSESRLSAYRKAARDRFPSESDDIEFDDEPVVTEPSTEGAFVQAWIWVRREDTQLCRDASCDEIVGEGGDGYDGYCGNHADALEVAE